MTHHSDHAGKPQLAVVTGASVGIGRELAKLCAGNGFDLVIAADQPEIHEAASELRAMGTEVEAVQADLATEAGVRELLDAVGGRPVAALLANAGHGLGHGFLDQEVEAWRHVIDTNVTGTLLLIHAVGKGMRERGNGRILITGSVAGFHPRHLPGGVQRHQGLHRQLFLGLARGAEGHRRVRYLPHARRDGHRVLRARRHARHQGRRR
jgi:short-subunit dehydrogenase